MDLWPCPVLLTAPPKHTHLSSHTHKPLPGFSGTINTMQGPGNMFNRQTPSWLVMGKGYPQATGLRKTNDKSHKAATQQHVSETVTLQLVRVLGWLSLSAALFAELALGVG